MQSPGAAGGLPERCIICDDPRQYIGWGGQRWATLEDLRGEGFSTSLRELEPDLFALHAGYFHAGVVIQLCLAPRFVAFAF